MTRQQKIVVIALAALNALVFCCVVPVIVLSSGGSSSAQVAVIPTATRTVTSTPTATPTLTPQATNTFVLGPKPTVPRATVTPRALEAGWKFYDVGSEGFAMALPPNWQKVDLDRNALATYIQTLKEKNPKFATAFAGMSEQLLVSQIKFFALDVSQQAVAANYLTSMNALREQLPSEMSLDAYVQANLSNLSKAGLPTKPPARKRVTLAAGAAEELKYQSAITMSGNEKITISALQYILVRGSFGYIVTFGTTPDKEKTYALVFQKMMQSFQWAP